MKLTSADYRLAQLAQAMPGLFRMLGDTESDFLGTRLSDAAIDRPVFVAGLARSGTTVMLQSLHSLDVVATHRYRDFPFVFAPYIWNAYQERFSRVENPIERPHRDRIRITKDSPDAFEEPIWSYFFPDSHKSDASHVLTFTDRNPDFDKFFTDHLRKILLLRNGTRYVSKGNYNITRIAYLSELFPDARFIIPIRHPVTHVRSLARQHDLFTEYSDSDPRVPKYLRAAGHYEFGPQRIPVNTGDGSAARVQEAWRTGDSVGGYAILWNSVYGFVRKLIAENPGLSARITVIRYEDLCSDPRNVFADILTFCQLEQDSDALHAVLSDISAPAHDSQWPGDSAYNRIWAETRDLAEQLGYTSDNKNG